MTAQVNRSSLRYTLKCDKCNYRFATEQDLVSHSCPEVLTEGFSCNNCKFVFDSDEPLKRHLKFCDEYRPNSENHVCRHCGDVFKSEISLKKHDLDAHAKKNQFQCKYCRALFSSHRNMSIHERVHEREPVSCSICKCQFTSFASLKVHIWQAHQQKMSAELVRLLEKCKTCYKYFDKEQAHICKKDSLPVSAYDIKVGPPYKCRQCDHVFFKYSSYEAHMYSHTVGNMADQSPIKRSTDQASTPDSNIPIKKPTIIADHVPASSERPYRCDICGCRFKYDFSLAAHISSHNSVERKVIDEFAKIIQSHENGEDAYVIEAIDVETLCKQSGQNPSGDDSKSHNGLLNLLIGHFPDEDLTALGIFQEGRAEEGVENSKIKIEPAEEFEVRELEELDKSQKPES